jgi:hypothetical protein
VSELFAAPEDPQPVVESVSRPLVLITAQEVAFSTAAAMVLPHAAIGEVRGEHRSRHADTALTERE